MMDVICVPEFPLREEADRVMVTRKAELAAKGKELSDARAAQSAAQVRAKPQVALNESALVQWQRHPSGPV